MACEIKTLPVIVSMISEEAPDAACLYVALGNNEHWISEGFST